MKEMPDSVARGTLYILGCFAYKGSAVGGRELTLLLTTSSNEGSVIMSNNMKEFIFMDPCIVNQIE